jgi:hypothetical protein
LEEDTPVAATEIIKRVIVLHVKEMCQPSDEAWVQGLGAKRDVVRHLGHTAQINAVESVVKSITEDDTFTRRCRTVIAARSVGLFTERLSQGILWNATSNLGGGKR